MPCKLNITTQDFLLYMLISAIEDIIQIMPAHISLDFFHIKLYVLYRFQILPDLFLQDAPTFDFMKIFFPLC